MNGLGGTARFSAGAPALALDDDPLYKSLRPTSNSRFCDDIVKPQIDWPEAKRHSIEKTNLRTYDILIGFSMVVVNSNWGMEPSHKDIGYTAIA